MNLTQGQGGAYFHIDVVDGKFSDTFDHHGKICSIWMLFESKENVSFKMRLCSKGFSENDFHIQTVGSWELSQTTIEASKGVDIEFCDFNALEFEQDFKNVKRMRLYCSEIDGKDFNVKFEVEDFK